MTMANTAGCTAVRDIVLATIRVDVRKGRKRSWIERGEVGNLVLGDACCEAFQLNNNSKNNLNDRIITLSTNILWTEMKQTVEIVAQNSDLVRIPIACMFRSINLLYNAHVHQSLLH